MRERVFVRRGKAPVLLVSPHGSDDSHTITLAKTAAEIIDCHAVINQGFERSDDVDVVKDKADCNRIDHVKQDVIFDEFLRPIVAVRDFHRRKLQKGDPWAPLDKKDALLVLHIHGVGNAIHKEANEQVACVLGYGLGHKKDSISCQPWRINLFIDMMRQLTNLGEVYEGAGGGKYAGRSTNNLNQYFRKHDPDDMVDSLQVEFPFSMRNTEEAAKNTAALLAVVVNRMLKHNHYSKTPPHKLI